MFLSFFFVCCRSDAYKGTWPWMAVELSHVGPGEPMEHKPVHDLESFFYVLLGVCLLFDGPKNLKSDEQLAACYDACFAVFKPTIQKTLLVQSQFGWTAVILPNISSYFRPIVPLLDCIRMEFILSIQRGDNSKVRSNPLFTHDTSLTLIADSLVNLPAMHWETQLQDDTDSDTSPPRNMTPKSKVPFPQTASVPPPCPPQQDAVLSSSATPMSLKPLRDQSDTPPSSVLPSTPQEPPNPFDPISSQPMSTPLSILPKPIDRSSEYLPRPNMIRRSGMSSGSGSGSRGTGNPLLRNLKSSSGGGSKCGSAEPQAGTRPAQKRAKTCAPPDAEQQLGGVP